MATTTTPAQFLVNAFTPSCRSRSTWWAPYNPKTLNPSNCPVGWGQHWWAPPDRLERCRHQPVPWAGRGRLHRGSRGRQGGSRGRSGKGVLAYM